MRDGEGGEGGGAENGGSDRRRTATSTSTSADPRSSKKALRSWISATLKAMPDEEMARQSE